MKTNNLTVLSPDELSAFQDILNAELKLWTKRLNSYSVYVYETSGIGDNDTVTLIIAAGMWIKYLKEIQEELTKIIEEENDETLQSIFE